jgi:gas vesicle protein
MSNRSRFFEGVVLGAAAGTLLALLFAPRSGSETRKKLRDLKNQGGPFVQGTKEKTEEMINKTMFAIENGFNKIGKMIDKGQKEVTNQYEEIHG